MGVALPPFEHEFPKGEKITVALNETQLLGFMYICLYNPHNKSTIYVLDTVKKTRNNKIKSYHQIIKIELN